MTFRLREISSNNIFLPLDEVLELPCLRNLHGHIPTYRLVQSDGSESPSLMAYSHFRSIHDMLENASFVDGMRCLSLCSLTDNLVNPLH